MLATYQKHNPKPTTKAQLQEVLQEIWDNLPQDSINKEVLGVRKRLRACVQADGGHFEHEFFTEFIIKGPFQGHHKRPFLGPPNKKRESIYRKFTNYATLNNTVTLKIELLISNCYNLTNSAHIVMKFHRLIANFLDFIR